jgi:membrane associated rhomboid family serine protease
MSGVALMPTMSRIRSSGLAYAFGPGPLTPAIKLLIWTNAVVFVVSVFAPQLRIYFGLTPAAVFEQGWIWQVGTYLFLHADVFHILFNMLALWMFGVELERLWGTPFFFRFYGVCGLAAAATTLAGGLVSDRLYFATTIGASGAVYGVLAAYALYYPHRPIYLYFLFPIPARVFVALIGAIVFLSSISDARGGVAHAAHLGGLVAGYLYLKHRRGGLLADLKTRYARWRLERLRRRFDVHPGGRGGWDRHVH